MKEKIVHLIIMLCVYMCHTISKICHKHLPLDPIKMSNRYEIMNTITANCQTILNNKSKIFRVYDNWKTLTDKEVIEFKALIGCSNCQIRLLPGARFSILCDNGEVIFDLSYLFTSNDVFVYYSENDTCET